tara:strand:- start:2821 stop:3066 length:246 start_codon:yes stop_codon:yes gene_type:complete
MGGWRKLCKQSNIRTDWCRWNQYSPACLPKYRLKAVNIMDFVLGFFAGCVSVSLWFYREQVKDKISSILVRLKTTYVKNKS